MPIVIASSFADPQDVQRYRDAIRRGLSERQALRLGDSGIGLWGDDTTDPNVPMCALPPEDWQARWGHGETARGKQVSVTYNGITVIGELRDTMPHRANITNGAGIDLNPGFANAFHVPPPFMLENVEWHWV